MFRNLPIKLMSVVGREALGDREGTVVLVVLAAFEMVVGETPLRRETLALQVCQVHQE